MYEYLREMTTRKAVDRLRELVLDYDGSMGELDSPEGAMDLAQNLRDIVEALEAENADEV